MERPTNEEREPRGLQLLCSKMFPGLERQAWRSLGFSCTGSVCSPLVPTATSYVDFFTKVVEQLEAGTQLVGALIEEEIRDRLSQALKRVFSKIFHTDPHFDFEAVIGPVPEVSRGAMGKTARDHVDEPVRGPWLPRGNEATINLVRPSSEDAQGRSDLPRRYAQ
ncbi:hypothetical protein D1007_42344 [Hordeum vulgare]|nr:hypothetical protein D1007_42344 [Hordeum vulgare]